jgi:hypothetical protein
MSQLHCIQTHVLWFLASLCLSQITMKQVLSQSVYETVAPELRTRDNKPVLPTEFPLPDSEQRVWASLVSLDAINRCGVLRLEEPDRMLEFRLLPSAALFCRGAPAALGDFPPGTMVEVWGYGDAKTQHPRHILRMSDDFSVMAFSDLVYRVDSIDMAKKTFAAVPIRDERSGNRVYTPKHTAGGSLAATRKDAAINFTFNDETDWYVGSKIGGAEDLAVGQRVQTNFIRKFYGGPPLITRCKEVWLDVESQELATTKQLQSFLSYTRDRAYPLRVDSVDDEKKLVGVTLLETGLNDIYKNWKVGDEHAFAAATTSLRMWEPNGGQSVPDRMFGVKLLALEELPIGYGCGGAKMTFSVPMLYEAYRVGTIIKLYPNGHPVPILPIEERMPKEFDTFLR